MSTSSNWAGNLRFRAERVVRPGSVEELRTAVAGNRPVRALGTAHSFSDVADTTGTLVSVRGLPPTVEVDSARRLARVAAGMTYAEVGAELHELGYGLHNLGSLPHISVAGSCATATHGSGIGNGNLATAVTGLELVTATGDLMEVSRDSHGEAFDGMVVALGALGVATAVTVEVEPTYSMAQLVYTGLPIEVLDDRFDEVMADGYSVSLFLTWKHRTVDQVWVKRRITATDDDDPAVESVWADSVPAGLGAAPAAGPAHPIPGADPVHCTEQLGSPGPWHERLPHFRPGFTPSSGEELQSEYLLPRRSAVEALRRVAELADRIAPLLQTCEVRTIAADRMWLSPSREQDTVAVHFTWKADEGVYDLLPRVEEPLAALGAVPHWGKLTAMAPDVVRARYPMLPAFAELRSSFDPDGVFVNPFVARFLFPDEKLPRS